MRALLSMAAASVMLSACTTTQLSKACTDLDAAHAAFVVVADATGKLKASTVTKEAAVHQDVNALCAVAVASPAQ